jgi:phage shock protein PspC (stress-responsive transcriptional regulator)
MAGTGGAQASVLRQVKAFGAFWYDFVIGDDWLVAAGVVAGLAATYGLSQAGIVAWWLLPAVLVVLLPVSLSLAASGSLLPRRTRARRTPPGAPRTPPAS